jgi:hypothetical protein
MLASMVSLTGTSRTRLQASLPVTKLGHTAPDDHGCTQRQPRERQVASILRR